ncbi:Sec-independent protein secretion pathway translocase [Leptospira ryugenii]|uniref:Sec-independent protein translocase protein TatC n=2 Tax=Leptospira ryugenii TaxID=1917863 RepID=A0A2P2E0T4_9LEPT|nr:Sec-independent protein secretion pathway translocase [Leptospira ryugenii]
MTLGEHLEELRQRLIYSILVIFTFMVITLYFGSEIHSLLISPYKHVLGEDAQFFQIQLMAPFVIYLKTSFMLSVLVSLPILLYILWGFIAPAVDVRTEKWGKFIILFSTVLFWAGLALCWFTVFENFLRVFLVVLRPEGIQPFLPIDEYYDIFFNLHLVFGASFELPIVLILLGRLRILSSSFLLRRWRESVLIIALVSAVLSPGPDVFSMMMLLLPLTFLFFLSACIMLVMEKAD